MYSLELVRAKREWEVGEVGEVALMRREPSIVPIGGSPVPVKVAKLGHPRFLHAGSSK